MPDKRKIIESVANRRMVENDILTITGRKTLTPTLADLSQMVYEVLLRMRDDIILEAYFNGQVNCLVARVVLNQLTWQHGKYYAQFVKYYERFVPLSANLANIPDNE